MNIVLPPPSVLQALRFQPHRFHNIVSKYVRYEPGPTNLVNHPNKSLIACTARSGSSYLSVEMDKYGLNFNEWLNTEGTVKRHSQLPHVNTTRDLANDILNDYVADGVFGLKAAFSAMAYLIAFDEIPTHLDTWQIVFLRRQNIVRQAISRKIAVITQQWTAKMARRQEVTDDDYDFSDILTMTEAITNENSQWERLFGCLGSSPLRVSYEEIVDNEVLWLPRIAKHLGATGTAQNPNPRTITNQSTQLNVSWEARFREEYLVKFRQEIDTLHCV